MQWNPLLLAFIVSLRCCGVLLSCLRWFGACILRECAGRFQIVGKGDIVSLSFQTFHVLTEKSSCMVIEDGLFYFKGDIWLSPEGIANVYVYRGVLVIGV